MDDVIQELKAQEDETMATTTQVREGHAPD